MIAVPRSFVRPSIGLVLVAVLGASCQSNPESDEARGEPYVAPAEQAPESIGFFLTNFDKSLRRWNELKLGPGSERDVRTLRALEANLRKRALERQTDLVTTLESGARGNRGVAAVALGFAGDPAAISPLVAALEDPHKDVVQKVLLGIGILGDPMTPVERIASLLERSGDPWTRNNAAYALQCVVAAGADDPLIASTCRVALIDEEAGVRAQAASILGMLRDDESVTFLGDLLADSEPLVQRAAITSLARIGETHAEQKGRVARLLVDAMDRMTNTMRNNAIFELSRLAGRNLGNDTSPWREWAYRMP